MYVLSCRNCRYYNREIGECVVQGIYIENPDMDWDDACDYGAPNGLPELKDLRRELQLIISSGDWATTSEMQRWVKDLTALIDMWAIGKE